MGDNFEGGLDDSSLGSQATDGSLDPSNWLQSTWNWLSSINDSAGSALDQIYQGAQNIGAETAQGIESGVSTAVQSAISGVAEASGTNSTVIWLVLAVVAVIVILLLIHQIGEEF